jgi:hypothetical protein
MAPWLGRAAACVRNWHLSEMPAVDDNIRLIQSGVGAFAQAALLSLTTLLHQVQHDLRMATRGPLSIAIDARMPFH